MDQVPAQLQVLADLMDDKDYDACRRMAERLLDRELTKPEPNNRDLAYLYIFLARSLLQLNQTEAAGEKGDVAAVLSQTVKDTELQAEAHFLAGAAYASGSEFTKGVDRMTRCLATASQRRYGDAMYNRGCLHMASRQPSKAAADFEEALSWAIDHNSGWITQCRLNLAWVLILSREFERAELVLAELEAIAVSTGNRQVSAQVLHDRSHMKHLQNRPSEAMEQALAALREAGQEFPHVRCHVALTLMDLAAESGRTKEAFAFGLMAKRLAAKAERPDLDEQVSQHLRRLTDKVGPEQLYELLGEMKEAILPRRRRRAQGDNRGVS